MTETFTADERAKLLAMAGVPAEVVSELTIDTTKRKRRTSTVREGVLDGVVSPSMAAEQATIQVVVPEGATVDELAASILARCKGNKSEALALADATVKAEFDTVKLSKFDAASRGLDLEGKTEHNRNAWAHAQSRGESIKAVIRKNFRENNGFIAAKIAKAKRPDLDAFMAEHGDSPIVRELYALLGMNN